MSPSAKKSQKPGKKFSYADYLSWADEERWETIQGVAYDMSPAPTREHQGLSGIIFAKIYSFLSDRECGLYFAPFDVRLPDGPDESDEEIKNLCTARYCCRM